MRITIENANEIVLNIPGMHCGGCARAIEKALLQVGGVDVASADISRKIVEVAGSASPADLVAAATAAGYEASVAENAPNAVERHSGRSQCCG